MKGKKVFFSFEICILFRLQGVIRQALNWQLLGQQYMSETGLKNEVQKMVNTIEGVSFFLPD